MTKSIEEGAHSPQDVDDRIAELRGSGDALEGHFTLDRSVAQEKLRDLCLEDPWSYVLELVQAAVLKDASYIDFEINARQLRMKFDGRPFVHQELDDLYDALLWDEKGADRQALAQLAMGLNSASALEPPR